MKVLDVGSGPGSMAAEMFKDDSMEITRLDADPNNTPDVVHDITQKLPANLTGRFDLVICSHMIEHIDRVKVITVLENIISAVKVGGELWISAPAMEWCAEEILKGNDNAGVQGLIFGGQNSPWDYHRSGFTLHMLRKLIEMSGLIIRKAYPAPFYLSIGDKVFTGKQNVVIAFKPQGAPNAIDSNTV